MSFSYREPHTLVYKTHVPVLPLVLNWKVYGERVMSFVSSVSLHYQSVAEIFKQFSVK